MTGHNVGDSTATISAIIGSTSTVMLNATATTAQATYTLNIPAGTALNTVSVEVIASPSVDSEPGGTNPIGEGRPALIHGYYPSGVSVSVSEIYIQS